MSEEKWLTFIVCLSVCVCVCVWELAYIYTLSLFVCRYIYSAAHEYLICLCDKSHLQNCPNYSKIKKRRDALTSFTIHVIHSTLFSFSFFSCFLKGSGSAWGALRLSPLTLVVCDNGFTNSYFKVSGPSCCVWRTKKETVKLTNDSLNCPLLSPPYQSPTFTRIKVLTFALMSENH